MENFKAFYALAVKYQTVIGYSALSLLAAVGENLFSSIVYKCPCNSWNHTYGLVFLLVPALLLFLLGLMLNMSLWKQVTGCCTQAFYRGFCYCCGKRLLCLYILLQVTFLSALPPLTWIAMALLKVSFFECIVSGLHLDYIKERYCGNNTMCKREFLFIPCASSVTINLSKDVLEEIQGNIRAESQVLGWSLIAIVLVIAVVATCISRCYSPVSHLQLMFWKTYIENEKKCFDEDSKQHAANLAERNVRGFFNREPQETFLTPANNEWRQISTANTWDNKKIFYSPLHKFIERKSDSIKESTGSVLPPAEVTFSDIPL